jgi:putative transcriptional regulator
MPAKQSNRAKSPRLAALHQSAVALHRVGAMPATTMRQFEALCLEPVAELAPEEIKTIRVRIRMSQPVFARLINASPSTVQKWESGEKHPSGIALKMLHIIKKHGVEVLA